MLRQLLKTQHSCLLGPSYMLLYVSVVTTNQSITTEMSLNVFLMFMYVSCFYVFIYFHSYLTIISDQDIVIKCYDINTLFFFTVQTHIK